MTAVIWPSLGIGNFVKSKSSFTLWQLPLRFLRGGIANASLASGKAFQVL